MSGDEQALSPAAHSLVGSWRLASWVGVDDDGTETDSMGPAPEGLLVYAPDGTMITVLGRGNRTRFAGDDLTGGSEAARAEAFSGFVAYGGRWSVEDATVRHLVELSLFPNWAGTTQIRRWEVDSTGGRLTLTSPPVTVAGRTRVQRLTWERVRP